MGYDRGMYEEFFRGYEPLVAPDVAQAAIYMLQQPLNVSVKALDIVPSGMLRFFLLLRAWLSDDSLAQRSLTVIDRKWNERQR